MGVLQCMEHLPPYVLGGIGNGIQTAIDCDLFMLEEALMERGTG